jgi:hypothetical protein
MNEENEHFSLNGKQIRAVHLLASGLTDHEVAEQVGVSMQTVNGWKNHNHEFILELDVQRAILWEQFSDYYRSLIPKAIRVLEESLEGDNPRNQVEIAKWILRCVKPEPKSLAEVKEEIIRQVIRVMSDRDARIKKERIYRSDHDGRWGNVRAELGAGEKKRKQVQKPGR